MTYLKEKFVLLSIVCLTGLILTIVSCQKDDPIYISYASVVNASANNTAYDVWIDNQKINSQAFEFGDLIDYFNAYSGSRTFSIFNRATNTKTTSKTFSL